MNFNLLIQRLKILIPSMVIGFAVGYYIPTRNHEIKKTEVLNNTKTQIIEKQKIKILKPNGEIVEKEVEKVSVKTEKVNKIKELNVSERKLSKYNLGLEWDLKSLPEAYKTPSQIDFGYRMGQSPVFLTTGLRLENRNVLLGIRLEI